MTAMIVMPFRAWSVNSGNFDSIVQHMSENCLMSGEQCARFQGLSHIRVEAGHRRSLGLALESAATYGLSEFDLSPAVRESWEELVNRAHWLAVDAKHFPKLIEAPLESERDLRPETVRIKGRWGEWRMESYHLGVLLCSLLEGGLMSIDETLEIARSGVLDTDVAGVERASAGVGLLLDEVHGRRLSNCSEQVWNERAIFERLQVRLAR